MAFPLKKGRPGGPSMAGGKLRPTSVRPAPRARSSTMVPVEVPEQPRHTALKRGASGPPAPPCQQPVEGRAHPPGCDAQVHDVHHIEFDELRHLDVGVEQEGAEEPEGAGRPPEEGELGGANELEVSGIGVREASCRAAADRRRTARPRCLRECSRAAWTTRRASRSGSVTRTCCAASAAPYSAAVRARQAPLRRAARSYRLARLQWQKAQGASRAPQ